ncbi:TAT-variant-translocated molybdopterin oxidoreductase [Microvirga puerhi]|uniref:TAT-variant-translocated molybdopterin oxidoreductase n=1 Tax=Microvirga puerhi TaxID=2876078 RepID=A0ABS7VL75_9HYPH|nr:TAT-variant-translocated molybdopterin oxidoreductase [Microvirga puerhi]MBZ6075698.1 TAT-variant-translocated molybdopterin oxidoreductase [Microvirga puerhi]
MKQLPSQHPETKTRSAIRRHPEGKGERSFWRSLEELAGTEEFRRSLEAEFPSLAPLDLDRRTLLKAMGASLALAGLTGCQVQEDEKALPYVTAPEFNVQGVAKWYATAVTMGGYAQPVLGKTLDGRPVKLEGNPDHPFFEGRSNSFTQAALLDLYDPHRSRAPRYLGRTATWDAFDKAMLENAARMDASQGEGFRLLTGTVTSPTLQRQIAELLQHWPKAQWHVLEPINEDFRREALQLLFGRRLDAHYRLEEADVIVSLDDDLLGSGPRQTLHGRSWSKRRLAFQKGQGRCLLMATEPSPTLTGITASDRLIASHSRIETLASALAHQLDAGIGRAANLTPKEQTWVSKAADALTASRSRCLATIGAHHRPEVQALGLLINERLGNFSRTIRFTEPIATMPPEGERSFDRLCEDMASGRVATLVMIAANPAYAAPEDRGFRDHLGKVGLAVHAGLHYDETAALSQWHAPLPHELESWSDARSPDGLVGLIQPLIRPIYDVRSAHVVMENLRGQFGGDDHAIVQATWRQAWSGAFDQLWRTSLHRGFIERSAYPDIVIEAIRAIPPTPPSQSEPTLHLIVRPDPTIWDGRYVNNPWLQELPKPLTKVTWENVILVSPQLAEERKISNGDTIRLVTDRTSVTGPAWIMPGQEAATVVVTLGYGRGPFGSAMDQMGYDAYRLQAAESPWHRSDVKLETTGLKQDVATTQKHHAIDGFDFIRTVAAPDEEVKTGRNSPPPSFYPPTVKNDPSWGMSIDLDTCIGCNACVVACVAENNIPMVGKELVGQGREMHWLRIDHYHEGEPNDPRHYFQPVPCMHCEQAPCEMGCPVNAAVHSFDGMNLQVYNRCIGTRTCSSFCPYKVRRFNWFNFTENDPPEIQAVRNPNVTVRARGVMEKCTYCVQRVSDVRIQAKKEGRSIRDGEVVTACQQACPTSAIVFGNVSDPQSQVSQRKGSGRDYSLLEEVNTRPRTTYLARIEEDLAPQKQSKEGKE